jgi:hypothetical protein
MIIAGVGAVALLVLIFAIYMWRRGGDDEDYEDDEVDGVGVSSSNVRLLGGSTMSTSEDVSKEKIVYEKVILDLGLASSSKYWIKLSGGKILILSGSKVPLREIDLGEMYTIELVAEDEGYVLTGIQKAGPRVSVRVENAKPQQLIL